MNKRQFINQAVRYALMTGAAVTAAGYTSTVSAADANAPAHLGKVTVTGSHIKRTTLATAQRTTHVSRQQIQDAGYTNINQLISHLSFSSNTLNDANVNDGGEAFNLRGLGANRNLVLVNGKRWLPDQGGTTNITTLPLAIIDHVDILQDGASAVYGSDAISGVINIITIKNFRGAEAHAHYGINNGDGHWDGQVRQYDFTVGTGNDRGNIVFNATYRNQNPSLNSARKLTSHPIAGVPDGIGGLSATPRGRFNLFGPAVNGRTYGQGTCGTYNPADPTNTLCDFTLQNAPVQSSTQNFRNYQPTDAYNNAQHGYLLNGIKVVSTYVQGHYDLFDNVTFTANAEYARLEARTQSSQPLEIGAGSGQTVNGQQFGIAATNPYNPFGVNLVANPNDPCLTAGACIGLNQLGRLPVEAGEYKHQVNRNDIRIYAGFNGYVNLLNREIDWDVGFGINRRDITYIDYNTFNLSRVKQALGPLSQCSSPCAPLDLFGGPGTITPAQLNYIRDEPHDNDESTLRDWTADISSDLYDLPAGPLGLAIGWEHLSKGAYHKTDTLRVQGNALLSNAPNGNGLIVSNAEYAELNIPLLADRPGAKSLSVDVANRWTQYDRSGGLDYQPLGHTFIHNSSGRLNIRYQPISDLLLRASWSQGFRSPSVQSLFTTPYGGGVPAAITDPCASPPNGGYNGGPLPANCPNGTLDTQPSATIHTTTGNNPNLKAEHSISRSFGFVYSPSQVPGLDFNADYFKIEITNVVNRVAGGALGACFNSFVFCSQISSSSNQVTNILNIPRNFGDLLTEGVDFGIHYKFPSTPVGDFDARITGTFVKTFDQTTISGTTTTGFATSHLAGTGVHPKRRFNADLNWDYGNWSASYRIEYLSSVVDQCTVSVVAGYCTYPNRTTDFQGALGNFNLGRQHLGATVYHDVNVGYTVPSINTTFDVGVNNLFDKQPPITGGGGFNYGNYRTPSRLIFGDIRVKF